MIGGDRDGTNIGISDRGGGSKKGKGDCQSDEGSVSSRRAEGISADNRRFIRAETEFFGAGLYGESDKGKYDCNGRISGKAAGYAA